MLSRLYRLPSSLTYLRHYLAQRSACCACPFFLHCLLPACTVHYPQPACGPLCRFTACLCRLITAAQTSAGFTSACTTGRTPPRAACLRTCLLLPPAAASRLPPASCLPAARLPATCPACLRTTCCCLRCLFCRPPASALAASHLSLPAATCCLPAHLRFCLPAFHCLPSACRLLPACQHLPATPGTLCIFCRIFSACLPLPGRLPAASALLHCLPALLHFTYLPAWFTCTCLPPGSLWFLLPPAASSPATALPVCLSCACLHLGQIHRTATLPHKTR